MVKIKIDARAITGWRAFRNKLHSGKNHSVKYNGPKARR